MASARLPRRALTNHLGCKPLGMGMGMGMGMEGEPLCD